MSRKSEIMQMNIQREFCDTMQELREIWDELGLPDDKIEERGNKVLFHFRKLLSNMVNEERELKGIILSNIEQFIQEIEELSSKLNVSIEHPSDFSSYSILQRDKHLRQQLAGLKEMKKERLRDLKVYQKEQQQLCDQLCTTPYYIASGHIPSDVQIKELKEHIENLKSEKERRWNVFRETKAEIVSIYDQLDIMPDTSFAHELITETPDSFCLSTGNMEDLKELYDNLDKKKTDAKLKANNLMEKIQNLWDVLEIPIEQQNKVLNKATGIKSCHIKELENALSNLQELKLANLQKLTERARIDISILWRKCYYSKDQRNEFTPAYDENYTEELLEAHEQELARLHAFYEDYKEMFSKVQKWQELFNRMLNLETKSHDINRFSNRGGNLLAEEKERKRIEKQLPRIEDSLIKDIEAWESKRHQEFSVEGIAFKEYVTAQWEAFEERKETEKTARMQKKKNEMKSEMLYGSTPKTPTKRRFIGMTTLTKNSANPPKRTKNGMDSTYRTLASTSSKSPGKPPIGYSFRGTPKRTGRVPLSRRLAPNGENKPQMNDDAVSIKSGFTDIASTKSAPNPNRSHCDVPLSTTVVSADNLPMSAPIAEFEGVPYCDFVHQITTQSKGNKVRSSAVGDYLQRK